MKSDPERDVELEPRAVPGLLDVLIRAGLIFGMVVLCYRVFSPFLTLTVWAVILAVALYPLQRLVAARLGGRQGLSATLLVILGVVVIVVPTAVLMSSLGDSVHRLINEVQEGSIEIPAPPDSVAGWPLIGEKVHATWSRAYDDLPAFIQSQQPKIGDVAKAALGFVASIGTGLLQFLASFIIAGIVMAFGESGSRASRAIFERVAGAERGADVRQARHGDHTGRCARGHRCRLHSGDRRRSVPAGGRHTLGGHTRRDRPRARHCPGARADRHAACHRLHLVARRLRDGRGDRLHGAALRRRIGGQHPEAADARPRASMRRCRSSCSAHSAEWRRREFSACSSEPPSLRWATSSSWAGWR